MPLAGFDELFRQADAHREPIAVAAAGGDDPTVLEALETARKRGWVRPIVVGPEAAIRAAAEVHGVDLIGFDVVDTPPDAIAGAAVAAVRRGDARMLMKGHISTPALLGAVLDPEAGLRTGQVICQVVLMEILRDAR